MSTQFPVESATRPPSLIGRARSRSACSSCRSAAPADRACRRARVVPSASLRPGPVGFCAPAMPPPLQICVCVLMRPAVIGLHLRGRLGRDAARTARSPSTYLTTFASAAVKLLNRAHASSRVGFFSIAAFSALRALLGLGAQRRELLEAGRLLLLLRRAAPCPAIGMPGAEHLGRAAGVRPRPTSVSRSRQSVHAWSSRLPAGFLFRSLAASRSRLYRPNSATTRQSPGKSQANPASK